MSKVAKKPPVKSAGKAAVKTASKNPVIQIPDKAAKKKTEPPKKSEPVVLKHTPVLIPEVEPAEDKIDLAKEMKALIDAARHDNPELVGEVSTPVDEPVTASAEPAAQEPAQPQTIPFGAVANDMHRTEPPKDKIDISSIFGSGRSSNRSTGRGGLGKVFSFR